MKARIKDTGEVVNAKYDHMDCVWRVTKGEHKGYCFHERELEFFDDTKIDWEQRRYEIAKDMMAAALNNPCEEIHTGEPDMQAKWAVAFADALIAELKNKNDE